MNYADVLEENEKLTTGPFQLARHKGEAIADTFLSGKYALIFVLSGAVRFTCKSCRLSLTTGNFIGIDTLNLKHFCCTEETVLLKYLVQGRLSRYIGCTRAFQSHISHIPILAALNGWIDSLVLHLKEHKIYSEEEYAINEQNLIECLLNHYSAGQLGELHVLMVASQITKVKSCCRTVSVIEQNSVG